MVGFLAGAVARTRGAAPSIPSTTYTIAKARLPFRRADVRIRDTVVTPGSAPESTVQVELTDRRKPPVRIVDDERLSAVTDLEPVIGRVHVDGPAKDPSRMQLFQRRTFAAENQAHSVCLWAQGADHGLAWSRWMGAEN